MGLEITRTDGPFGAVVRGVDLSAELDEATIAEIRAAWLEHHVLVFPDQHLDEAGLERHTLRFGPFGHDQFFYGMEDHPHVVALHRAADETASIFADNWHSDWSFQDHPPDGTCLYSRVVPPEGDDTWFVDQTAAFAEMPDELKQRISGLTAQHSAKVAYAPEGVYGDADADSVRATRYRIDPEARAVNTHPVVRPHPETGVPSTFSCVGYICGIEGMPDDEALGLLLEVHAWQTQERFQYRHRWEPDMLVMWDNRCVLHKATGGYDGHERLMWRTTVGYNADMVTA